jgi:hypothetical protein
MRGEPRCGPLQVARSEFERKQDGNGQKIEKVVTSRHCKGSSEFLPPPHVRKRHHGIGYRGTDVRPHDHGNGVGNRERILRCCDECDDHRCRYRRALDERRRQNANHQRNEWVLCRSKERLEYIPAKRLETVTKPVDPHEKDEEQG